MRGLFITGTDTDVGKTFVTAAIARQLRAEEVSVGVYKPACSGALRDDDGQSYWADVENHFQALAGENLSAMFRSPRRTSGGRASGESNHRPLIDHIGSRVVARSRRLIAGRGS